MEEKIKIVENDICVDLEQLKKIIIDKWQSGELYRFYYNQGHRGALLYRFILDDVADYIDGLFHEMEIKAQKKFGRPEASLDWLGEYPKSDIRSIGFEVANKLASPDLNAVEKLTTDDIPAILEFLDTPPDKTLGAWDKWEKYWANLDYPERRKKLLENAE